MPLSGRTSSPARELSLVHISLAIGYGTENCEDTENGDSFERQERKKVSDLKSDTFFRFRMEPGPGIE